MCWWPFGPVVTWASGPGGEGYRSPLLFEEGAKQGRSSSRAMLVGSFSLAVHYSHLQLSVSAAFATINPTVIYNQRGFLAILYFLVKAAPALPSIAVRDRVPAPGSFMWPWGALMAPLWSPSAGWWALMCCLWWSENHALRTDKSKEVSKEMHWQTWIFPSPGSIYV